MFGIIITLNIIVLLNLILVFVLSLPSSHNLKADIRITNKLIGVDMSGRRRGDDPLGRPALGRLPPAGLRPALPGRGAAQAGGRGRGRPAADAAAGRVRAGVPAARRGRGAAGAPGRRLPALRAAGVRAVQPGRPVRRRHGAQPVGARLPAGRRAAVARAGRAGRAAARAGLRAGARLGHAGRVARAARGGPRARRGAGDAGRARAAAAAQHALRAVRGHAGRHLRRHRSQRLGAPPLATSTSASCTSFLELHSAFSSLRFVYYPGFCGNNKKSLQHTF